MELKVLNDRCCSRNIILGGRAMQMQKINQDLKKIQKKKHFIWVKHLYVKNSSNFLERKIGCIFIIFLIKTQKEQAIMRLH